MSQSLTHSLNCKFKFLSWKNICIHFTGKLTLESSSMMENLKSSNFSDISSLWMGMERKCVNGCLCRAESTSTSTRVLAEITPFLSWPFISGRHSVKQTTLCQHFHLQCWFSLVVDWTRTFLPLSKTSCNDDNQIIVAKPHKINKQYKAQMRISMMC